jgi:hypothetical protein
MTEIEGLLEDEGAQAAGGTKDEKVHRNGLRLEGSYKLAGSKANPAPHIGSRGICITGGFF